MDVTTWIIIGRAVAAFVLLKQINQISAGKARDLLKNGAKVIDVRSAGEFQSGHLPNAINIPLDQLEARISKHVTSKDQAILLHCLSGGRSGIAKGVLKRMGYIHAFNLGSYSRAEKILGAR